MAVWPTSPPSAFIKALNGARGHAFDRQRPEPAAIRQPIVCNRGEGAVIAGPCSRRPLGIFAGRFVNRD